MRWLALLAWSAIGCASARVETAPSEPAANDPLGGAEEPLTVETLPGDAPPATWPPPIIYSQGAYLIPWRDARGQHARVVRAGRAPADRYLGSGALAGAAAWRGGFAMSSARGQVVTIYFFDDDAIATVTVDAAGLPAPALAGDGESVLIAATVPSGLGPLPPAGAVPPPLDAHALWIRPDAQIIVELGLVDSSPALYGDGGGYIVDGRFQLDAALAVALTPAAQVAGARLYRHAGPRGDAVTADGAAWLETGGDVAWAVTDERGAAVEVSRDGGDQLLALAPDLSMLARATVPPSARAGGAGWVRGVRKGRALYEATLDGDHAFAILDRAGLAPRPGFARVAAPSSRTVAAVLGDDDILFAWLDDTRACRYAIWPR